MAISESPYAEISEYAFEGVFKKYFTALHGYAYTIVRDEAVAEGIVQEVFLNIWEKGRFPQWDDNPGPYLYRSVHNRSLNHLKKKKVKQAYETYATRQVHQTENTSEKIRMTELQDRLNEALEKLPEQCRIIFQMSRFREMKYQEIAAELKISLKTVEAQMGKALKRLRVQLADYLPLLLIYLLIHS